MPDLEIQGHVELKIQGHADLGIQGHADLEIQGYVVWRQEFSFHTILYILCIDKFRFE